MKKLIYILSIFAVLFAFGSCEKEVVTPFDMDQDEYICNEGGTRGGDDSSGGGVVTDPDEDEDFDEEEDEDDGIVDPDEDEDFDEEEEKGSTDPGNFEGK
ncbi:MAG: hypothetical protein ACI857_002985 [Arenicella sp.]|jgi:hypothetical protein